MRVMVLGGGVIGTTTAYYLAKAGCQVTVIERADQVAQETSHANAGQISPGYASPWAAPGVPLKALKWLTQRDAPLKIRLTADPAQYQWLWQLWQQCTPQAYARNKARMVRLSEYSRDCLDALREQTGIAYEGRQAGTTQVFRTSQQLEQATRDIRVLEQAGVPYQLLDRAGILRYEPALAASAAQLTGALRLPLDQTGDCQMFTRNLAELAQGLGVEFRFRQTVQRLAHDGHQIQGIWVNGELLQADRYVMALASYSRALLMPLGLKIPVYPLKGYSLTLPILDPERAPQSTVLDETYKVAITRFDSRIRVGGMAEVAGFDLSLNPVRRQTLEKVVNSLFPGGGDLARTTFWTGLRPATPDGTPLVGPTRFANLYLNTGHGTLGWTMACGSGRLLSDIMLGLTPEIDTEGLDISRYHA